MVDKRFNILMEIKEKNYVKWLERIKTSSFQRDKTKYCWFHKNHDYDTDDCHTRKDEIESMIKRGYHKCSL